MFGDPLFWLCVLPGLLLGAYAQSRIKLNIAKYSRVSITHGVTGGEVARRILDARGLGDVAVEPTPGMLSDHYDPRTKTLRLSQNVYFAPTVAAAGIAAHEAGHAIQDADDYLPLEARTYIVPLVQLRIPVTTNESDYARASCGDVTRGGWIPGMALRQYAGRYDRHARDSAKVGVGRLEAR